MPKKQKREVFLVKSIFEGRPDTIYFQHPDIVGMHESERINIMSQEDKETSLLSIAYNSKEGTARYSEAIKRAGFSYLKKRKFQG